MIKRIVIALAIALALGGAYAVLVRKQSRTAQKGRAEAQLLSYDDRAVSGFTLTVSGAAWHVVRDPRGWRIVAPVGDQADAATVDALVATAHRAPVVQTIAAPDALATYGLDPPRATLAFEGVPLPALQLGNSTPAGDGIFLRVEGRPGVLIAALPQASAFENLDPDRLRTTAWIDLPQSDLRAFTVARAGVTLSATRRSDGWWLTAPRELPAAQPQVDRLLGALYAAKVVAVDDAAQASDPRFGLGSSAIRVELTAGSATRKLAVGADAGEGRRFATSDARGTVLVVEGRSLGSLPQDAASLRETRLTNVNRYAISRFDYAAGSERFAAARAADKTWSLDGGAAVPADDVYRLLVALLEAPTSGYSEGRPAGTPAATLRYTQEGGATGEVVFYPGPTATWGAVPGVVFRLAGPPPAVPRQK
jgi:uncharacterized protein DUF4340